jgi:hypothetical protein
VAPTKWPDLQDERVGTLGNLSQGSAIGAEFDQTTEGCHRSASELVAVGGYRPDSRPIGLEDVQGDQQVLEVARLFLVTGRVG